MISGNTEGLELAKIQPTDAGRDRTEDEVRRLELVADLVERLSALGDPKDLQEEILAQALQFFDCTAGTVFLWDGDMQNARRGPAVGRAGAFRLDDVLAGKAVRQRVISQGRPLVLPEPGVSLGRKFDGIFGLAVVPVVARGRVAGVLVVGDRADGRPFGEADEAMMAAVGNAAGSALATSVAFTSFRDKMTRRMSEAMAQLSRASAELARVKTFNENLLSSTPVGLVVFDPEMRITFRNAAGERLWPEDRSVTAGACRCDLATRDPEWHAGLKAVLQMQRPWRAEQVVFRRGEETVRVNLTCSPLLGAGRKVLGGVLVVEDVTQHVLMEQRLEVSERLAGVGRLAAMVAHEINNPLDGIIRLVNLARRVAGDEEAEAQLDEYLAQADKGLARLATVVRDLLAFSRTADGTLEPMPIRETLLEAADAVRPQAERAGVCVAVECPDDLPALRSGALFQVVLNLVKNAVEAMPDGGEVAVGARIEEDALVIDVADTGPGLPEDRLRDLWQPFFTRKASTRGTGLGLVISRDLVEKQGGGIEAANRPEGGARFTITIPLAPHH